MEPPPLLTAPSGSLNVNTWSPQSECPSRAEKKSTMAWCSGKFPRGGVGECLEKSGIQVCRRAVRPREVRAKAEGG